jgi:hypothetical protein
MRQAQQAIAQRNKHMNPAQNPIKNDKTKSSWKTKQEANSAARARLNIIKVLRNVKVLSTLNDEFLEVTVDFLETKKFGTGEMIIKEGELGSEFYIIQVMPFQQTNVLAHTLLLCAATHSLLPAPLTLSHTTHVLFPTPPERQSSIHTRR